MIRYDENHGYRGAVQKLDISGDWGVKLSEVKALSDIGWKLAVVLETSDQSARIGFQPPREPGGAVVRERRVGIVPLDGVKWAKASRRSAARAGAGQGESGARSRRRDLCRAAGRGQGRAGGSVSPAPDPGNFRCDNGHGSVDWPCACYGRRVLLRPEPVQPCDASAAAAGLLVQAVRLCRRPRQWLYAVDGGDGFPDLDRPGSGGGRMDAAELFGRQVLRTADSAVRDRVFT